MLAAKRMLHESFPDSDLKFSSLYRTPPVGGPSGQGDFLNAVVSIRSQLDVWEVWDIIKRIEVELGRQRLHRWEARRIDIDVLLHDDVRIWTPHFKVPHPRMCMRAFILRPASEIASDWVDPVSQWTIQQLDSHIRLVHPLLVVTPDRDLQCQLQNLLGGHFQNHMDWLALDNESSWKLRDHVIKINPKLIIVAVSTPDPETVQWEDFARQWAIALGMDAGPGRTMEFLKGPRYLLPANDLSWAAHEMKAAFDAMNCPVEIAGSFANIP